MEEVAVGVKASEAKVFAAVAFEAVAFLDTHRRWHKQRDCNLVAVAFVDLDLDTHAPDVSQVVDHIQHCSFLVRSLLKIFDMDLVEMGFVDQSLPRPLQLQRSMKVFDRDQEVDLGKLDSDRT